MDLSICRSTKLENTPCIHYYVLVLISERPALYNHDMATMTLLDTLAQLGIRDLSAWYYSWGAYGVIHPIPKPKEV